MILDRYDEETYTLPLWRGSSVYHEDVLFFRNRKSARLLYPIDRIISVRSYDLQTEFTEGTDYTVKDGELYITENSAIPVWDIEPFTAKPDNHVFPVYNSKLFLTETCCIKMRQMSIAVSYEHKTKWADGYSGKGVDSLRSEFPQMFSRLDNGGDINILIYGDSMSSGWGSSGSYSNDRIFALSNTGEFYETCINVPPYSPAWYDMFISAIRKQYPKANINLDNISFGGTGSKWGADNLSARLKLIKHRPDVVMIGFGINDICGNLPAQDYKHNIERIIEAVKGDANGNSDACFVLYSSHTCNSDAECYRPERFAAYEEKLAEIAGSRSDVAHLPLYSLFADMAKSKVCSLDRLENNINHCMDMGGRVYAQAMIESFK